MIYRMAEYYLMLYRKHKVPIKQFVISMSKDISDMIDELHTDSIHFKYSLLSINSVDYRIFLQSPLPEVKMFALLADLSGESLEDLGQDVLRQILRSTPDGLQRARYLNQLLVIANLRNLKLENSKFMLDIDDFMRNHPNTPKMGVYQMGEKAGEAKGFKRGLKKGIKEGLTEGRAEGREEGRAESEKQIKRQIVLSLLALNMFSPVEIANIAQVDEAFIRKVQAENLQ